MTLHDPAQIIQQIQVDGAVKEWPYTQEILARAASMGIAVVNSHEPAASASHERDFTAGKRMLRL
ncbi:MAG TPA: DNA photolyase, partial [Desulfobacterales bacterium]|nr:DNA photolyase [Desulfobacterales bacterium]